jgi:hypothetical protein
MIKYNLKEDRLKNHPMDGKYGVIVTNTIYAGYPLTIVDNSKEIEGGKYTDKSVLCLLHLSENVRQYTSLKLYDEFLYLSFAFSIPTYRMYAYEPQLLSTQEIIAHLKTVLYELQPTLQSKSMVGYTSKDNPDYDPNYYEGYYVLNDEEEYTILRYQKVYKFFKGNKTFYPHWAITDDLIFEGELNFDVFRLAKEVRNLRRQIITFTNQILDEEENTIAKYKESLRKLKSETKRLKWVMETDPLMKIQLFLIDRGYAYSSRDVIAEYSKYQEFKCYVSSSMKDCFQYLEEAIKILLDSKVEPAGDSL